MLRHTRSFKTEAIVGSAYYDCRLSDVWAWSLWPSTSHVMLDFYYLSRVFLSPLQVHLHYLGPFDAFNSWVNSRPGNTPKSVSLLNDNMLYSLKLVAVVMIFGDLYLLKIFTNIFITSSQLSYPAQYFTGQILPLLPQLLKSPSIFKWWHINHAI